MGGDGLKLRRVRRGGRYLRIADPAWSDPLDGMWSARRGGRWNAPGSFPVVYLNRTLAVARANVRRRFAGLPYGPQDLDPQAAPILVATTVPEESFVDVISDEGCRSAGLPASYPFDREGREIGWDRCRPCGQAAWEEGATGIACRSATSAPQPGAEELAWFQRRRRLAEEGRHTFEDWFWPTQPD